MASLAPDFIVASHAGPYGVRFEDGAVEQLDVELEDTAHVLVDGRVAEFHPAVFDRMATRNLLRVEATEAAKSLERFPEYVDRLVEGGIRRDHVLVAVGGGIVQDVTSFLAALLMRGIAWRFYPTTLLAQADSCIGSKSSINVGQIKNILGTFTPPSEVVIDTTVLETLPDQELRSGIGEILKVHAIDGPSTFDELARDYKLLLTDRSVLTRAIRRALEIKKQIIELDEFDRGPRNVMNYGHSFGHAIESATSFVVPHGIAVTIGMDMANHVAAELGWSRREHYERMHSTLATNYAGFEEVEIPIDAFIAAISRDKKNVGSSLRLILPDEFGAIRMVTQPNDSAFRAACEHYFAVGR